MTIKFKPTVPNAAFVAAADVSAVDDDTIDSILEAGAPEIVAAALVEQAAELRAEAKRLTSNLDRVPDATAFAVGAADGALTKQARRMEALAAELRGERL